ncbi:carbonic anhydrase family protein [Candidatus Kapabacteria bacterium]|nr:carbonic anhydrase family protein [Candidatus Kapabacteria bacterium]
MPIPKVPIDYLHAPTHDVQSKVTPDDAIKLLISGNNRFINNLELKRNHLENVHLTAQQQSPYATILGCIDSRVSPELIFDLGIGDIFDVRVAGNFINDDIIGSIEYACTVAGSKLVLIMGHTNCGAIKGAIDKIKIGKIKNLIEKIEPAVQEAGKQFGERNSKNQLLVDNVSFINVKHSIKNLLDRSKLILDLKNEGKIKVIGGMYHVDTGKVNFFEG